MASSTLTSKGQMTLPKEIRDRLALKAGDRLDVSIEDHRIVLTPKTLHLSDICSILPHPKRIVTIDEMERAIETGASE